MQKFNLENLRKNLQDWADSLDVLVGIDTKVEIDGLNAMYKMSIRKPFFDLEDINNLNNIVPDAHAIKILGHGTSVIIFSTFILDPIEHIDRAEIEKMEPCESINILDVFQVYRYSLDNGGDWYIRYAEEYDEDEKELYLIEFQGTGLIFNDL